MKNHKKVIYICLQNVKFKLGSIGASSFFKGFAPPPPLPHWEGNIIWRGWGWNPTLLHNNINPNHQRIYFFIFIFLHILAISNIMSWYLHLFQNWNWYMVVSSRNDGCIYCWIFKIHCSLQEKNLCTFKHYKEDNLVNEVSKKWYTWMQILRIHGLVMTSSISS